jgi:dethiobiotin synthetase
MCRELFARGKSVAAYKPVISDFDSSDFGGSDSAILLQSIGKKVSMANIEAISPWRFKAPLSPDMAARRENREINFSDLLSFCAQALSGPEDVKIIEGIGGLMVPLTSSHIWHDGDQ